MSGVTKRTNLPCVGRSALALAGWLVLAVAAGTMGGVSTSTFRLTNGVAVFRGEVSLENNGGFASVRSLPARHAAHLADIKAGGSDIIVLAEDWD